MPKLFLGHTVEQLRIDASSAGAHHLSHKKSEQCRFALPVAENLVWIGIHNRFHKCANNRRVTDLFRCFACQILIQIAVRFQGFEECGFCQTLCNLSAVDALAQIPENLSIEPLDQTASNGCCEVIGQPVGQNPRDVHPKPRHAQGRPSKPLRGPKSTLHSG